VATSDTKQDNFPEDVTPEMIEAGYRILLASGLADDPLEADRLVVVEIYRAMASLRPLANPG
jgi:hypothetical protein